MARRWGLVTSLLVSVVSVACQSFENSAIVRTVELGGSLVHVTTTFAAKALEGGANVYTIALEDSQVDKTSYLDVRVKGAPSTLDISHSLDVGSNLHLIDVTLPQPLSVGDTVNLVLETVQTRSTWPWPETAAQKEEQALKYQTELFVLSPYATSVQRTKIKSMTPRFITYTTPKEIEEFTSDTSVTKTGATLTYGPYNNIPASANVKFLANAQQLIQVHYHHDFPVLELTSLKRSAEISHWGANLNIQDEITLHNAGPKLKGHFSRLEHQAQSFYKGSTPHVLPGFTLHLPAGIRDTYYYDLNGNVSTSHLRVAPHTKKSKAPLYSVIEMKPRYPLLGGWNYSFTLGWDAPLEHSTTYNKATGQYTVEIPIMTLIPDAVVGDAELQIILPEGATDVDYKLPFPAVSSELKTHVTYLDSIGRPSVVLKYYDLTDKHAQTVFVTYKVPLSAHFRKPVVVSSALFSVFALLLLARRVDLSISGAPVKERKA